MIGLPRPCCCCRINSAASRRLSSATISNGIGPGDAAFSFNGSPQHFLYLSPLLHGHGSFRPIRILPRFKFALVIQTYRFLCHRSRLPAHWPEKDRGHTFDATNKLLANLEAHLAQRLVRWTASSVYTDSGVVAA